MPTRGIRGATVAAANTSEAIHAATRELLLALVDANDFDLDDIASLEMIARDVLPHFHTS